MALELPYGIKPLNPLSNLDKHRYGPHASINDALDATWGTRELGLTVGIIEDDKTVEYWFEEGILNTDLVKKVPKFPEAPVTSVNGQTGDVVLDYENFAGWFNDGDDIEQNADRVEKKFALSGTLDDFTVWFYDKAADKWTANEVKLSEEDFIKINDIVHIIKDKLSQDDFVKIDDIIYIRKELMSSEDFIKLNGVIHVRKADGVNEGDTFLVTSGDVYNALQNFDPGTGLPDGGTATQLLVKQSEVDGDADWEDPSKLNPDDFLGDGSELNPYSINKSVLDPNDFSGDGSQVDPYKVNKSHLNPDQFHGDGSNEFPFSIREDITAIQNSTNFLNSGVIFNLLQEIEQGEVINGVPSGGLTNQILAKNSGSDFDLKWVDQLTGDERDLEFSSNEDYILWRYEGDTTWNIMLPKSTFGGGGTGLPDGGTSGQLIVKQSSTDGDAEWEDPSVLDENDFEGDGTTGSPYKIKKDIAPTASSTNYVDSGTIYNELNIPENRAKQLNSLVLNYGVVEITSETNLSIADAEWKINGSSHSFDGNLAISTRSTSTSRIDIVVAKSDGTLEYIQGTSSNSTLVPNVPNNSLLLYTLLRSGDGGGGGISEVSWGDIIGDIQDQNDLMLILNGKSDIGHTHEIDDVDGLQEELDAKISMDDRSVLDSDQFEGDGTEEDPFRLITDSVPTENSIHFVNSGSLYTILQDIETGGGGVPFTRSITAGVGLAGGGDLTQDRTISAVFGTTQNTIAAGNDPRINNGQTAFSWGNFRDFGLGTKRSVTSIDHNEYDQPIGFYGWNANPGGDMAPVGLNVSYLNVAGNNRIGRIYFGNSSTVPKVHVQTSGGAEWAASSIEEVYHTGNLTLPDVFTRTVNGLVPSPGGSGSTRFLREDGTWATPSGGGGGSDPTDLSIQNRNATTLQVGSSTGSAATIPSVTTTLAGLMSAADKVKLNDLTPVDTSGFVPSTRSIIAGDHLFGGGNLTVNRTLSLRLNVNSWIQDSQSNNRIFIGQEDDPLVGFIFRLSGPNQLFRFRKSDNTDLITINQTSGININSSAYGSGRHLNFNRDNLNYITASNEDGSLAFVTGGKTPGTDNSSFIISPNGHSGFNFPVSVPNALEGGHALNRDFADARYMRSNGGLASDGTFPSAVTGSIGHQLNSSNDFGGTLPNASGASFTFQGGGGTRNFTLFKPNITGTVGGSFFVGLGGSGNTLTYREIWHSGSHNHRTDAQNDARYALSSHTHTFASLTSKPTTISGYGITDAVPTSRTISAGTGLTGGGNLSANRSISFNTTWGDGRYLRKDGSAATLSNVWAGTRSQFNAIPTKSNSTIYIVRG